MKKKLISSCLISTSLMILESHTSFANEQVASVQTPSTHNTRQSRTPYNFSGFYVGAFVGGTTMNTKVENFLDLTAIIPAEDTFINTLNFRKSSFMGNILLGYRKQFANQFIAGFELNGGFFNQNMEKNYDAQTPNLGILNLKMRLKRSYSIRPSLILGWAITPRMAVLGSLGVGSSRFEQTLQRTSAIANQNTIHTAKQWAHSLVPGLGFEYALTPHFSLAASFHYEFFQQLNFNLPGVFDTTSLDGVNRSNLKPAAYNYMVGIVYKF
ncbi:outer membrane protein [Candidatus Nucleicultrix amoebiphila]|jgi:opacity protein-like surface antigen|uniref:Outer membrane protein OmpA-like transmembrane domain-containing protein n=1 Tax=Candidatus Nucleicultrix amoebiphila FS5 TaxID=1414854 RepID=A0A1W6N2Z3_9PROT|nr:hypothetical protein [Candidatus Nucleicultrix amoebiphila]ARN84267.1 hypothetical protein GQ61_01740 [Candidatus Nucleicultrix amoebiphila FS5]